METENHLLNELSDDELTSLAKRQLPHVTLAFEELVKRHENKVYAICLRYFGCPETAEEVSQETFIRVFQQLINFRGDSQFSTWLYRIALNLCHTVAQKKSFVNSEPLENYSDDIQLSEEFTCDDEEQCVQYCINQQNEQEKAMISMRFNTELSLQEIADILDIKLSATKMRLYRAMESFKTLYEKYCT
ncbi:RNA polymerase sigma factor SigX [Thiomicrorhabdus immobilis]|uniref:RNA polymerase sigma factor SigX n=1 Tax=Thiomicrorhabdus immobilis TaxID=2791037 RepID=A0ABN6CUE1_9GAMM|nr:sigma-70 family RNA polymerase sigma factor [Thiomicrorhabdus immobilis]BCN92602.1 RNA polymerase sigma factor SigX [Thiomicrorhabdus immobilis]